MLFEPHYGNLTEASAEDGGDQDVYDIPNNAKTTTHFLTLLNNTKMKIRQRPAVVRVPYFKVTDDPDNYYYSLLAQYLPFRNERELLLDHDSSKEAFLAQENQLKTSRVHGDASHARSST